MEGKSASNQVIQL